MLFTNLDHVESDQAFGELMETHENVMLSCGRMGPMCLPVYDIMDNLKESYPHVHFRDMDFDGPASNHIRRLPEVQAFTGLPFTVYFRKGKVMAATTSIQTPEQIMEILDRVFPKPE